jgi:hypothetical protein
MSQATDTKDKPVEAPWHCHALNQVVFVERLLLSKSKPVLPFPVGPLHSICHQAPEYNAPQDYFFIHPIIPEYQNPLMLPAPGRAPPAFMGV